MLVGSLPVLLYVLLQKPEQQVVQWYRRHRILVEHFLRPISSSNQLGPIYLSAWIQEMAQYALVFYFTFGILGLFSLLCLTTSDIRTSSRLTTLGAEHILAARLSPYVSWYLNLCWIVCISYGLRNPGNFLMNHPLVGTTFPYWVKRSIRSWLRQSGRPTINFAVMREMILAAVEKQGIVVHPTSVVSLLSRRWRRHAFVCNMYFLWKCIQKLFVEFQKIVVVLCCSPHPLPCQTFCKNRYRYPVDTLFGSG